MVFKRSRTTQRGAALVVGLVLLLVLTLLAVSTMRSATLALVMAGNAQNRENAFRLAEAGIADAIGQARGSLNPAAGWTVNIGPTGVTGIRGDYQASVRYRGTTAPFGGFSTSDYQFNHYQVDVTGQTDRGARSRQSQGLIQVGPKIEE